MSEPITRADLDMLVAAAIERVAKMTPAEREDMMEAQRQSWVRGEQGLRRSTESASPPRVPVGITGPVLPYESGPGQPIDIVERLEVDAHAWDEAAKAEDEYDHTLAPVGMRETATLEREAAAEIARLREQVRALEHEAANMANRRVELEDSVRLAERRAGIEAAAQWHSEIAKEHRRLGNTDWSAAHEGFAATMRALADKPAPVASTPLSESVKRARGGNAPIEKEGYA